MYYKLKSAYRVPGSATLNAQGKMEDVVLPAGTIIETRDFKAPKFTTNPDGTPKLIGYYNKPVFVMPAAYPIPPSNGLRLWAMPPANQIEIYDATNPAQTVAVQTPMPAVSEDELKIVSVDTGTGSGSDENLYVVVNQMIDQLVNQTTTTATPVITTTVAPTSLPPITVPAQRKMYRFTQDYSEVVQLYYGNAKSWPVKFSVNDRVQVEPKEFGSLAVIPTDNGDLFFLADHLIEKGVIVPFTETTTTAEFPPDEDAGPIEITNPNNTATNEASIGSKLGMALLIGAGLYLLVK